MTMERKDQERLSMNRALRDLLLEASEDELREALADTGETIDALAARGRAAVQRAQTQTQTFACVEDLHRGLGALLQMLRLRERLSVQQLAENARVDAVELGRIELDPGFDAQPRTIVQLARYFKIPEKSLIALSGAVRVSDDMRQEVVRFAAHSENISGLTGEQRKLLNRFVKFLKERTDG
jgi:transcriptional regulator with XRE-family HTH domain